MVCGLFNICWPRHVEIYDQIFSIVCFSQLILDVEKLGENPAAAQQSGAISSRNRYFHLLLILSTTICFMFKR